MEPEQVFLGLLYFWIFAVGAGVGSWLNVCILRLPLEKSVVWPSSRCMTCLQPIRWHDNVPILGYFLTRGRCRVCGQTFSIRYALIELLTGLAWVALFHFEIVCNHHHIQSLQGVSLTSLGAFPWWVFAYFLHHAIFVSLLILAVVSDMDHRVIPLAVTIPGTIIGIVSATLFPWPWPTAAASLATLRAPLDGPWYVLELQDKIPAGLYLLPVWGPLPAWLPAGSWQCGLATGLAGALAGMLMLRVTKFVFEQGLGKEALGLGDADLMMMAGAFLGWQIVVVAFFIGAVIALMIAIPQLLLRGDNSLPFGPGLGLGLVITWAAWPSMGGSFQLLLFDPLLMGIAIVMMSVGMFVCSVFFRFVRPGE